MIKVVMAEDQGLLASALQTLLNLEDDIEVIAQASNGEEALKLIREWTPDIALLDIEMPKMTGLEVAEKLKNSTTKLMMLTTFAKDGYFERAIKANVSAYLLKDTPSDELVENIRGVLKGRKYFSPELMTSRMITVENPLNEREIALLKAIQLGATTKEAADQLFLSHGTVRNYISEILSKLEAKNRMEAISIAEQKGWL